jgi:tetratricopeptide (TPR) repeat protein
LAGLVLVGMGLGGCESAPVAAEPAGARTITEAEAMIMRGDAALARGDRETALLQFARAIEINPRLTRAHMGMGEVYRVSGDYAKAELSYRQAATVEPRSFDAQYMHGLMLHLLNRCSEAVGAYIRALQIRPEDFQANLNLATAYYQLNEHRQALPYAENAVRLQPRDGRARFNLGVIYAALDRHKDAVTEYQQAAELMDLSAPLLINLADSLSRLGRYEEMRNTLAELLRKAPTAAAHERLGFACFKLGRYDDARASFNNALAMDADYFPALNGLGVCDLNQYLLSERRDVAAKDRALAALRRSIMLNRNQPRIEEFLTRYR